jgi:hypothetical protein
VSDLRETVAAETRHLYPAELTAETTSQNLPTLCSANGFDPTENLNGRANLAS